MGPLSGVLSAAHARTVLTEGATEAVLRCMDSTSAVRAKTVDGAAALVPRAMHLQALQALHVGNSNSNSNGNSNSSTRW